jgi:uncharacterized protein YciI
MRVALILLLGGLGLFASTVAAAGGGDKTPPPAAATAPATRLYAVEFRTGPAWVAGKPPNEQAHFAEHSANLRRLRESGALRIGARYADKGLVVIEAASLDAVRDMIDADPSIAVGTFVYELHEFSLFYEGTLTRPGKTPE